MKKTYQGSCHCGAVRFQASMDLAQGTFKCNCSFCFKARSWMAFVPAAEFRLLAGEDKLGDYRWNRGVLHHHFCTICGVRPFTRGVDPKGNAMVAVRVNCLDGVDAAEFAAAPVTFFDMLHDNPTPPSGETRHL